MEVDAGCFGIRVVAARRRIGEIATAKLEEYSECIKFADIEPFQSGRLREADIPTSCPLLWVRLSVGVPPVRNSGKRESDLV